MSRSSHIALRIVGIFLLLVVMAGIGFAAFQAGYANGALDSPEVAAAIENAREESRPVPYSYGIRAFSPFGMHAPFGFFPLGAICGLFLVGFLVLVAIRLIFRPYGWGPWKMHPDFHHHPWGPPPWAPGEDERPAEKGSPRQE
ncbi:MAG: hypothetical protein JXB85_13285 [Anaerolineales bacterium]|nr:hypothetical protein [Anaerolineales bacterium]